MVALEKALEAVAQRCFVRKVFATFTGKHLCQGLFVAGVLQPYLKRDYGTGVFL